MKQITDAKDLIDGKEYFVKLRFEKDNDDYVFWDVNECCVLSLDSNLIGHKIDTHIQQIYEIEEPIKVGDEVEFNDCGELRTGILCSYTLESYGQIYKSNSIRRPQLSEKERQLLELAKELGYEVNKK